MKRKYTKEQILNAILYWTKKLNILNETKIKVIDALISHFGEELVLSREKTYILNKDDLSSIFNILNLYLFENKLGSINLLYWPEYKIVNKLNQHAIESEAYNDIIHHTNCYGVHSVVCKDIYDSNNKIIDVKIYDDIIMLNSTYLKECIFIFAVACICHEMIHFYDRFSQEYHDLALLQSIDDELYNFHYTNNFLKKMHEANLNGINVIILPEKIDTYDSLNSRARLVLGKVLDEDESSAHVTFNGSTLCMRGKGSHKFFIAQID